MALVPTSISRDDLFSPVPTRAGAPGPIAGDELMGWIQTSIPSGDATSHSSPTSGEADALLALAYQAMEEVGAKCGSGP